jgi:hypothetical protein
MGGICLASLQGLDPGPHSALPGGTRSHRMCLVQTMNSTNSPGVLISERNALAGFRPSWQPWPGRAWCP